MTTDFMEQVACIQRQQEEVRQFCSEQHRHSSGSFRIGGSRDLPVWLLATTAMMVGAALFGAGMAFMKWLSM